MRFNTAGGRYCDDGKVWSKEDGDISGNFFIGNEIHFFVKIMSYYKTEFNYICYVSLSMMKSKNYIIEPNTLWK